MLNKMRLYNSSSSCLGVFDLRRKGYDAIYFDIHFIGRKWKTRLPQVDLAYRLRCKDPGSAPVPGQPIRYVVTNNGGKQLYEKVETLQDVERRTLVVDRRYYVQALETPLKSIFTPLVEQREPSKERAAHAVQKLLWPIGGQPTLRTVDPEKRRRLLEGSALMQCWAKQKAASSN